MVNDYAKDKPAVSRYKSYIVKHYHDIQIIPSNDIKYVLCKNGVIELYTVTVGKVTKRETLVEFMKKIQDPAFNYISRDCIVNLRYVNRTCGNRLYLSTGEDLRISRRKVGTIKQLVTTFL